MIITTEAKAGFNAQPVDRNYDILSKLYREIGISAVAAALQFTKAAKNPRPDDNQAGHETAKKL